MIFQLFPKATSILNHICIEEIQWVMMEHNCLSNVFCPKCPCEMYISVACINHERKEIIYFDGYVYPCEGLRVILDSC